MSTGNTGPPRGFVTCAGCGTHNPSDAEQCLYCGENLRGRPQAPPTRHLALPREVWVALGVVAPIIALMSYAAVLVITAAAGLTAGLGTVGAVARSRRLRRGARLGGRDVTGLMLAAVGTVAALAVVGLATYGIFFSTTAASDAYAEPWLGRLFYAAPLVAFAGLLLNSHSRPGTIAKSTAVLAMAAGWFSAVCVWGFPVELRERASVRKVQCLMNVAVLSRGLRMYSSDWDAFPPAATWCDRLAAHAGGKRALVCPEAENRGCSYAYNASLDRLSPDAVVGPDHVVSIFESDRGWNAAGGRALLPKEPRHFGGDNYGFADGHARWISRRSLTSGPEPHPRWAPQMQEESR